MTPEYHDELWDEIPIKVFISLGQRGAEPVKLRECFVPGCPGKDPDTLHVEKKEIYTKKEVDEMKIVETKYTIHCDTCGKSFKFVFNKHIKGADALTERVYTTDAEEKENYGEIGWV